MEYLLILTANCLFILYGIMYFVDHKFVPEETGAKIKNVFLLCAVVCVSCNVLFIYILKKENEQSGLIYKIASGAKHSALNVQACIQPFQQELFTSFIIAGVIIGISILILGMPGGLIVEVFQNIVPVKKIEGDDMWPAALYVSFFWPLCFPIAVLVKNYLIQQSYAAYASVGLWISGSVWVSIVLGSAFFMFRNKS